MLKKISLFVCGSLLFSPLISYAEKNGFYVGGQIGISGVETKNSSISNSVTDSTGTNVPSPLNYSSFGNNTDSNFAGGLFAGYDFSVKADLPLRLELNYTNRSKAKSNKSGDTIEDFPVLLGQEESTGLQTLMTNVWFDIPTGTKIKPYVGVGVGAAFIDYETTTKFIDRASGNSTGTISSSKNQSNFAWSAGIGMAYEITPKLTVDLGYRYIDAGKASASSAIHDAGAVLNSKSESKIRSNEIFLGGRYHF